MRIKQRILALQPRPRKLLILFSVFLLALGLLKLYKTATMPPPFVYLVPENYFGPVFVFFGQKDGVDMQPDRLGQAVTVPENGLIKLKLDVDAVISRGDNKQNIYWVKVAKDGSRKNMLVNQKGYQDKDGEYFDVYHDEHGQPQTYPLKDQPVFYYFSAEQKKREMVFYHGGCRHQQFKEDDDKTVNSPHCGKFLIMSPNKLLEKPRFLWSDLDHQYDSIAELEKDLDDVAKRKFLPFPASERDPD